MTRTFNRHCLTKHNFSLLTGMPLSTRKNSSIHPQASMVDTIIPIKGEVEMNKTGVVERPKNINQSLQYKLRDKTRLFVDFIRIKVKGGRGGDGCVAFHRERFKSRGPPSGGNGGMGGHVIIVANPNCFSLHSIRKNLVGNRGENGKGEMKHGSSGKDIVLNVPLGTIVREIEPPSKKTQLDKEGDFMEDEKCRVDLWVHYPRHDEKNEKDNHFLEAKKMIEEEERFHQLQERVESKNKLSLDISIPYTQYIVTRGGVGGKGNPQFITTTNRSPKFATRGREGQVKYFELEVKTIADVSLVGLPNAGKSTFLTAVSNARPKIASYPFTTLNPYIGTIDYADRFQLKVADIPGLIQGAHRNIGLGHSFLRHVERSRVLVYVVDLSSSAPWEDFEILQNELEQYKRGLTQRPSIIIANKADITSRAKKNFSSLEKKLKQSGPNHNNQKIEIVPVSSKYRKNIVKVTALLRRVLEGVREKEMTEMERMH